MTVTLDTTKDVRLSADVFWTIVDDALRATKQDLAFRYGAYSAEWTYFQDGRADHLGPRPVAPITATVTRD